MALRTAINFGEFLTVFSSFTPTPGLARFVTCGTLSFRFSEIVNPNVFRSGTSNDLLPVDGLHVTEIVVVKQSAAAGQNVPQCGHLQIVHLRQGDNKGKFFVVNAQFEQRPTANNLQIGKDDPFDIDVRDEDVTSHFSNVLQKGQVEMFILEPGEFQIAIDVGAVCVAIAQIAVVMFPIRWHGHPPVCTDTNCINSITNSINSPPFYLCPFLKPISNIEEIEEEEVSYLPVDR